MSAAQTPPSRYDRFRPPPISLMYSGMWSVASHQLYQSGQNGWELGTVACLGTGGMAIAQLLKAIRDQEKVRFYKERTKEFAAQKDQQGQAHWATAQEIAECKFLSSEGGVFLGSYRDPKGRLVDIYYDGEGSISIIAPPGEGKSTSIVIPTLLANPLENLIVNDPKGEVFAICKEALEAQGYEVIALCPFAEELSERLGMQVVDAKLDIFSEFNEQVAPHTYRRRLSRIAKWYCPDKPNMQDRDRFFYKAGRMLGGFFNMNDLLDGYKPSLPSMREHLMQGMDYLPQAFAKAQQSDAFGGVYAELARSLGGILEKAPQQFAGGFGVLDQHIDVYDHFSELGQHTTGSGFDPSVLKDPHKKTAVFLISGLENIEMMTATTSLTLNYLFDSIAADMQQGRCTAIIDECGSLTGLSSLPAKLERYRGANLRCVMIWQNESQAELNFGRVGYKQILASSKVKVGMGLQEPSSLSMFSKACGTQSVEEWSLNDRSGVDDPMPRVTHSNKHSGIPLFREDAIRTMSDEELLMIGGNLHALRLQKVPYFLRPQWRAAARPNPFRGE